MNPMRLPILLLLTGCAAAPRSEPRAPFVEPMPEPLPQIELPPVPPLEDLDPFLAPQDGCIERDTALADRFSDEQQRVGYRFEARAGELALLGLSTWGYGRGWHSRARIAILDERGKLLLEERHEGGEEWGALTPFVAPADGSYRYEIALEQGYFRYRLSRASAPR